jgi:hypothetical protein
MSKTEFIFSIIFFLILEISLVVVLAGIVSSFFSVLISLFLYFIHPKRNNFLGYRKLFKKTFLSLFIFIIVYILNYNILNNRTCYRTEGVTNRIIEIIFPLWDDECAKITKNYTLQESGDYVFICKNGKHLIPVEGSKFALTDKYIVIERDDYNFVTKKWKIDEYNIINLETGKIKTIKKLSGANISKSLRFYWTGEYFAYVRNKKSGFSLNDFFIFLLSLVISIFILRKIFKNK